MILDEGHMLGAGLAMTNKLQTARSLLAERRWVMTGDAASSLLSASFGFMLQSVLRLIATARCMMMCCCTV